MLKDKNAATFIQSCKVLGNKKCQVLQTSGYKTGANTLDWKHEMTKVQL